MVLHAHATVWKEQGFLTSRSSPIQHKAEILQLVETVNEP